MKETRLIGAMTMAATLAFSTNTVAEEAIDSGAKLGDRNFALGTSELADSLPLNPVVVTATRTERRLEDSLTSVSVIDRESLRRQQPRDFSEILRGTSNVQSILLVDGIRMGSITTGGATWQFLPPQMIDRAEIVRGPRSTVYGADAIGGVIEVFTDPDPADSGPWAQVSGGSFGTHQYGGGLSGSHGNTHYTVGASHFHTDGIALRPGGEEKGFHNTSGLARIQHDFDNGNQVAIHSLRSEGRTEFIGGVTDFVHQASGARLSLPLGETWESVLSLGESRDAADNFNDFGGSRFDSRRQSARWQNIVQADSVEYVIGLDYLYDQIDGTTDYDEKSRSNVGAFLQSTVDLDPAVVEVGIRQDDNQSYGTVTTGSLATSYRFENGQRLRFSVGEGFRAPTFNELYFPGFGNPDLEPENSRSLELGLSAHRDRYFWDAALYQTQVENLIETIFSGGAFLPQNVARARITGLELGSGLQVGEWTFYGALTRSEAIDRDSGNRLRRRARDSGRLEVDRNLGDWSLGATLVAQGHRFDDAEEEDRLAGFGLLNLRTAWHFADAWTARLVLDNVLDRDYVTARDSFNDFDYQQPGRSAYLSLIYRR